MKGIKLPLLSSLTPRKTKAQQQQSQPMGQPPTQEMFMGEYAPAELIDTAANFQHKTGERIQA